MLVWTSGGWLTGCVCCSDVCLLRFYNTVSGQATTPDSDKSCCTPLRSLTVRVYFEPRYNEGSPEPHGKKAEMEIIQVTCGKPAALNPDLPFFWQNLLCPWLQCCYPPHTKTLKPASAESRHREKVSGRKYPVFGTRRKLVT